MLHRLILISVAVIAALASTFAALEATTSEAAIPDARASYEKQIQDLLSCLADSGYDARATQALSGVFYNIEVDFPPADSATEWENSADTYTHTLDACTSEDLLDATADLEALTRPSDAEMRTIADTCAAGREPIDWSAPAESDVEATLTRVAAASPVAAECIVVAMQEHASSLASPQTRVAP